METQDKKMETQKKKIEKFSAGQIITMLILIVAFLAGVSLGAMTLAQSKWDSTLASAFSSCKEHIDALPDNKFKSTWFLAYYGGIFSIIMGLISGSLLTAGIVLKVTKGNSSSFDRIMFWLGLALLIAVLATGLLAHGAAENLTDSDWLLKTENLPHTPA